MPFANEFFFKLRKRIPSLRRRSYSERSSIRPDALGLDSPFPLGLRIQLSEKALRLNEFYFKGFEQLEIPRFQDPLYILDLGSKDFAYAPALSLWALGLSSAATVEGVELDPYQIYFDLYRRGDLARYYVQQSLLHLPGNLMVSYRQADWLQWHPTRYPQVITSLFPFLFEDLHYRFGLPKKSFDPERFYRKLVKTTQAYAVFFHQGDEEENESRRLLQSIGGGTIIQRLTLTDGARRHAVNVLLWQRLKEL